MGYQRSKKTYRLVFKEDDLAGLEVTAKSMSLGAFLELGKLIEVSAVPNAEDVGKLEALFDRFSKVLVEWNLENESGEPIPASKQALYDQDLELVMAIIMAYMDVVSGVSGPLEKASSDGKRSLEGSIPMETLS